MPSFRVYTVTEVERQDWVEAEDKETAIEQVKEQAETDPYFWDIKVPEVWGFNEGETTFEAWGEDE